MTNTYVLPTVPSELLQVALYDFMMVAAQDDKYKIDPYTWHRRLSENDKCAVCLAGTVMANTIQVPIDDCITPWAIEYNKNQLLATDAFRGQDYVGALNYLGYERQEAYVVALLLYDKRCKYNHDFLLLADNDYVIECLIHLIDTLKKLGH